MTNMTVPDFGVRLERLADLRAKGDLTNRLLYFPEGRLIIHRPYKLRGCVSPPEDVYLPDNFFIHRSSRNTVRLMLEIGTEEGLFYGELKRYEDTDLSTNLHNAYQDALRYKSNGVAPEDKHQTR